MVHIIDHVFSVGHDPMRRRRQHPGLMGGNKCLRGGSVKVKAVFFMLAWWWLIFYRHTIACSRKNTGFVSGNTTFSAFLLNSLKSSEVLPFFPGSSPFPAGYTDECPANLDPLDWVLVSSAQCEMFSSIPIQPRRPCFQAKPSSFIPTPNLTLKSYFVYLTTGMFWKDSDAL